MKRKVIVCGSGLAGLAAALTALEEGADVQLVEKAPEPGGTFAMSGGIIWTYRDLQRLWDDVPDGNPVLQELVHSTIWHGLDWLHAKGVRLGDAESVYDRGIGQRCDPMQAIEILVKLIRQLGGRIHYETALDSIVTVDGSVKGARVVDGYGNQRVVEGDSVVLATGGFQGDPELLARYVDCDTRALFLRCTGWNSGGAFSAALAVGAAATPGLERFYGHAVLGSQASFGPHQFTDASQMYGWLAVAVNLRGCRFTDETAGTGEEEVNWHLAKQPGGQGFYIVDSAIADSAPLKGGIPTRVILDRARAFFPVLEANSLLELGDALMPYGVPRDKLLATLETFNKACSSGRGVELDPPRIYHQTPLMTPPFYAVPVRAAITFTTGGIAIDDNAQVLRRSASTSLMQRTIADVDDWRQVTIPGLFAVGCDVGGISGRGYAGGLGPALTTGRIAGRQAAGTGT